ncbi:MAG: hypothetical protein GTO62_08285 [Planctomycetales bacterium]|nr:hypothetical protein [Planctomycetales bacterium]NIP69253.1 hypothetical protein [Planctomycetales bacterium]
MALFNELKRRNVFRVAIAYVVVAWLILQVADVILNNVQAPTWAFWLILLMLSIGFILVLVFSWVFELTPEGIKRESEVDRSESITPQTGKKLDRLIIGVLVLAVAYFAVDKFWLSAGRDAALIEAALEEAGVQAAAEQASEPDAADPDDKSIAVLPFVNMSDDAGNEYFSDGISEEILNALAKVKELKVAGRTSSFAFKGQNQDLRLIGETLGVQNILEGSVRKAGDKVRITAQLVKVDDGFHLWSETYDRRLDDVFAIQDEIANAILQELKATLLDEGTALVSTARTDSEVYDLYLLAKQRMYERTRLMLQSAAELLDRAIAIDPEYAPAYAQRGIAALLLSETSYGEIPHDQSQAQAKLYLDKAVALDGELAEAWAGMGLYYNGPPSQPRKGIEALERALAINPNLINAGNWLTLAYWQVNRLTEAMALLNAIKERDPLYKPALGNRAFQLVMMGKAEEARAYVDGIEPFMPDDIYIKLTRAWIDFSEGQSAAGLRRIQAALEQQPTNRAAKEGVNQGHYMTHQFDKLFDDHYSDFYIRALFNLGQNEEAMIVAQQQAAVGVVAPLFRFLNASDQSGLLIDYLEERWPDLEAFQRDVPAAILGPGFGAMADVALAYRRAGNREQFVDAMYRLDAANREALDQGITCGCLKIVVAGYHSMAGETDLALASLAEAIDGGFITSAKISLEFPFFRELDGNPEYEAIQARMIENLNRERKLLGLDPI